MKFAYFDVVVRNSQGAKNAFAEHFVDGRHMVGIPPGSQYEVEITLHFSRVPDTKGKRPKIAAVIVSIDGTQIGYYKQRFQSNRIAPLVFQGFRDFDGKLKAFEVARTTEERAVGVYTDPSLVEVGKIDVAVDFGYEYHEEVRHNGHSPQLNLSTEMKVAKKDEAFWKNPSLHSKVGQVLQQHYALSTTMYEITEKFTCTQSIWYNTPITIEILRSKETSAVSNSVEASSNATSNSAQKRKLDDSQVKTENNHSSSGVSKLDSQRRKSHSDYQHHDDEEEDDDDDEEGEDDEDDLIDLSDGTKRDLIGVGDFRAKHGLGPLDRIVVDIDAGTESIERVEQTLVELPPR